MAEGVGSAPTSVVTDPVFETGAASSYLPAFHKIGCQGWTRTNTERLNRPPCYFDTTWQWLIGAAGRSCTCMSSFRRRTPHLVRPRQHSNLESRTQKAERPSGERGLGKPADFTFFIFSCEFERWSEQQDFH